jgi:hypothetical protein
LIEQADPLIGVDGNSRCEDELVKVTGVGTIIKWSRY